jgi:hypothetical protein
VKAHDAQVQQSTADAYLELEDGTLASQLIGAMSRDPKPENFDALGRLIRAGVAALGKLELERVLARRRSR